MIADISTNPDARVSASTHLIEGNPALDLYFEAIARNLKAICREFDRAQATVAAHKQLLADALRSPSDRA
jgi:hypothetical protein